MHFSEVEQVPIQGVSPFGEEHLLFQPHLA
jgi:hypothetical protein